MEDGVQMNNVVSHEDVVIRRHNGHSKKPIALYIVNGLQNGDTPRNERKELESRGLGPKMAAFQKLQFPILVTVVQVNKLLMDYEQGAQIILLILFGLFADFDAASKPVFQDTHVMIFIGFGFLMTFLKRYGFSAVSVNLLLACITVEWALIVRGLFTDGFKENGKFAIGTEQLLTADFAAAVILISMGAMLGKMSPSQYVIMAVLETPAAIITEHFVVHHFKINDVGGSLVVHAFGAYFGLALSKAFAKREQREHENEGSVYHTDIFAMIGAIFLWVFWPSFNGGVAEPAAARQRAVANTYLSLAACTIATFVLSHLTDHKHRFNMVHVANSTLAGGVAIGATANVVLHPLHALLVGTTAGILSVVGFVYLTPFLARHGIHDTCGVNNLHGMPGVLAGLVSVLLAFVYPTEQYGSSLSIIYPGFADKEWSRSKQALHQLAALGIVIVVSIVTGFITGFVLKLKFLEQVRDKEFYADEDYFEVPDDYDFTSRIVSRIDHVEVNEHTALTKEEKA